MKSPMVQTATYIKTSEKSGYTDLRVLQSGAGWYVGTLYWNPDHGGFWEPGSRDTGYFDTKEEATAYLQALESGEELPVRMRP
jgi:hypothetical protein